MKVRNVFNMTGMALVLAAALFIALAACSDGSTDDDGSSGGSGDTGGLSGTWIMEPSISIYAREIVFSGNTFTCSSKYYGKSKGTYTLSGSTITFNQTHVYSSYLQDWEPNSETYTGSLKKDDNGREYFICWNTYLYKQ